MADLVSTLTSMRIEPMPRQARKNIYTEHRTVDVTEPQSLDIESSVTREPVIEIGDRVVVAYDDPPGQQAVLIVASEQHDPDMGTFKSSSPTDATLLGKTVDDEVTVLIGDRSRSATILAINKNDPMKENHEPRISRDPTVTPTDLNYEKATKPTPPPLIAQEPTRREPQTPQTPDQDRRPVEPRRTSSNRVIEELRTLNERFETPRCSICRGEAQLAVNNEGPLVVCINHGCKKIERVDVQTLQRLADRLCVTCYQCNGTNLESQSGKFSNYLKCRVDGANNSWKGICDRIGKL